MATRPTSRPARKTTEPTPGLPEFGQPEPLDERNLEDTVVKLYRCATVVKGGRRFSFGALVVVGDRAGQVGYGYGKANEVPPAVEKGIKQARRAMFRVPLRGTTIHHRVVGKFGASRIIMLPALPGTGVIAGAAPRAVLELAGIRDVLTKCYGSTSPKNLVKATINGLKMLRPRALVEELRGVALDLPPEPEPLKAAIGPEPAETVEPAAAIAAEPDSSSPVPWTDPQPPPKPVQLEGQETPHDD